MKTSLVLFAATLALALASAGCPKPPVHPNRVELQPISAAPPARRFEVVNKEEAHTLSVQAGVAFAVHVSVSLFDDCSLSSSNSPELRIADESVLRGRVLARGPSDTEYVLWGVKAGKTTVTLRAAQCATQVYEVTVAAPPTL